MADDDAPATEVPNTPEPPTEPHADPAPPARDESLREAVDKLQATVDGLTQRVEALTPLPGDDTPTTRPWTHRGIR